MDEGVKFDVGKGAFMLNDLFILFAGGFFAWFRSLGHYSLHPLKKLSKLKVHILFRHVNDANLPSFN